MSKTQAERAAEYRQRKRDAVKRVGVTLTGLGRDENVTDKRDVTERDGASVTVDERVTTGYLGKPELQAKPTFDDLPLDVQREIDRMCYETTGQRAGSHTRQAMTERALHYQAMRPSPYSRGASTTRPVAVTA